MLYYDGNVAAPTIYVAPAPAAGTLELYTYEALATLANLSANIAFPDGYERALSAALAVELAPEYGRSLEGAAQKAEDAETSIFGLNAALFGPPQPRPTTRRPHRPHRLKEPPNDRRNPPLRRPATRWHRATLWPHRQHHGDGRCVSRPQ